MTSRNYFNTNKGREWVFWSVLLYYNCTHKVNGKGVGLLVCPIVPKLFTRNTLLFQLCPLRDATLK